MRIPTTLAVFSIVYELDRLPQVDYLCNDTYKFIPNVMPYISDNDMPSRKNQVRIHNERGSALLDVCISSGLRILNGRKPGDSLGYYTCHKYNGSSTVDYGITSENLFNEILYFHVHREISDLSDHCQISLCIKNMNINTQVLPKLEVLPVPNGYIWGEDSEFLFQQTLCTLTQPIGKFLAS